MRMIHEELTPLIKGKKVGGGDGTGPRRGQHQSRLHFIGEVPWSDAGLLTKVREMVLPAIGRHGPIEAWIIDDTGCPK